MENLTMKQYDAAVINGESTGYDQTVPTELNLNNGEGTRLHTPASSSTPSEGKHESIVQTYPRKQGISWASAEKIDGVISPKQHVDWVMMSQFGISLEYLINFVHNLSDKGCSRCEAIEAVIAHFGFDEVHADAVSGSLFGEPFYALIADIHGLISDYEPNEDDDWSSSKYGMHEYVLWAVMEELAFLKMDEVNPNP